MTTPFKNFPVYFLPEIHRKPESSDQEITNDFLKYLFTFTVLERNTLMEAKRGYLSEAESGNVQSVVTTVEVTLPRQAPPPPLPSHCVPRD